MVRGVAIYTALMERGWGGVGGGRSADFNLMRGGWR